MKKVCQCENRAGVNPLACDNCGGAADQRWADAIDHLANLYVEEMERRLITGAIEELAKERKPEFKDTEVNYQRVYGFPRTHRWIDGPDGAQCADCGHHSCSAPSLNRCAGPGRPAEASEGSKAPAPPGEGQDGTLDEIKTVLSAKRYRPLETDKEQERTSGA